MLADWEGEEVGEATQIKYRWNKKWSRNDSAGAQQWLQVSLGVRGREGGQRGDRVITHRPIAVLRAAIMVRAETCNHAALEHLRREETLWFRPFARARSYAGQNFCSRKNRSTDADGINVCKESYSSWSGWWTAVNREWFLAGTINPRCNEQHISKWWNIRERRVQPRSSLKYYKLYFPRAIGI